MSTVFSIDFSGVTTGQNIAQALAQTPNGATLNSTDSSKPNMLTLFSSFSGIAAAGPDTGGLILASIDHPSDNQSVTFEVAPFSAYITTGEGNFAYGDVFAAMRMVYGGTYGTTDFYSGYLVGVRYKDNTVHVFRYNVNTTTPGIVGVDITELRSEALATPLVSGTNRTLTGTISGTTSVTIDIKEGGTSILSSPVTDSTSQRVQVGKKFGAYVRAASGNAPALGSMLVETLVVADTIPPTVSAAAVANGTPTIVALTMSEAMDTGNVPAASAFAVSGHTVSSVAISGNTINLTCSAAFVNGEAARTVSYTQPGTANARDLAGNLLGNFSAQAITNNVAAPGDTTAPALSTAQVLNSAPTQIVLTFNETLGAFTPAASAFAVSGGKTVASVARSGAQLTLTCSAAYAYGDTITITYTKPGANQIQDASNNQTANFGPSAVTNSVAGSSTRTWTSARTFVNVQGAGTPGMTTTPLVGLAVTAYVNDQAGNLIDTKAGLVTGSDGKPPAWTGTAGNLATDYRVTYKKDSDSAALAIETLRCT